MDFYRAFWCFAAVAFVSFPAMPAHAGGMAATFDLAPLQAEYAQGCTVRQAIRTAHILPPYDAQTPAVFRPKTHEFLITAPDLNNEEARMARQAFAALAPQIRDLVYMQGVVYIAPRVIADAQPGLAGDTGYYNDNGLYRQEERRAYIPMAVAQLNLDGDGHPVETPRGGFSVSGYVPATRDRLRMITHESGHAVDDILGRFSRDGNGEQRLSSRPDFVAAFNRDLDALAAIPALVRNKTIAQQGYYLPEYHNGIYIGGARGEDGEPPERNRREVFAELFAERNSHSVMHLSGIYPRSFALVKAFDSILRTLRAQTPIRCNYMPDGDAKPALNP